MEGSGRGLYHAGEINRQTLIDFFWLSAASGKTHSNIDFAFLFPPNEQKVEVQFNFCIIFCSRHFLTCTSVCFLVLKSDKINKQSLIDCCILCLFLESSLTCASVHCHFQGLIKYKKKKHRSSNCGFLQNLKLYLNFHSKFSHAFNLCIFIVSFFVVLFENKWV